MRWDLSPNVALKIQLDRFKVHSNAGGGWVNSNAQGAKGTLGSVVVDFVWGQ